jgi:hypothetical protein
MALKKYRTYGCRDAADFDLAFGGTDLVDLQVQA